VRRVHENMVGVDRAGNSCFMVSIYVPETGLEIPLADIPLAELRAHEISLDSGRFAKFSDFPSEHIISYELTEFVKEDFSRKLDWLGSNATQKWNFKLEMLHMNLFVMNWHFQSKDDATLFKLSF
jgi:hypothetical protein